MAVSSPSRAYSKNQASPIDRRVAPNTFKMTESARRCVSPLATVPASTAMPATNVTSAVRRMAPPSSAMTCWAVATASFTETADTLENWLVMARSTASAAASSSAWVVAIQLCGAESKTPGLRTNTKLMLKLSQSTTRRFAMVAVISRPSTLMLTVSPIVRPKSLAAS